jgi:hypothetical protein
MNMRERMAWQRVLMAAALTVVAGSLLLTLYACGGGGGTVAGVKALSAGSADPARSFGLPNSYDAPAADPELLASLTAEFNRCVSSADSSMHAPQDNASQVRNLAPVTVDGRLTLVWPFTQSGDYDQNGEVGVQDITPIAQYWEQTITGSLWSAARLADGNGDGEVSIADITDIAQNFQSRLDGYVVYCDGAELARVPLTEARKTVAGTRYFTYDLADGAQEATHTYSVAPYLDWGGVGIASAGTIVEAGHGASPYAGGPVKTSAIVVDDQSYDVVADEVLLVLDEPADLDSVIALAADGLQGELAGQVAGTNTYRVRLTARYQNSASTCTVHSSSATLGYHLEYNTLLAPCAIPAEPRQGEQWNLGMLHLPQAWESAQGQGVAVAVIDTGVAAASEFGARLRPGYSTRGGNTLDEAGHGTLVAGLIAAGLDRQGIAGGAPQAELVPVKAGGWADGGGWQFTAAELADALDWAIHDGGCRVVNFSLGSLGSLGTAFEQKLAEAEALGVIVIGAAGNDGREAPFYPAAYGTVLSVGAVDRTGARADYSNHGSHWVDCCAPGGLNGGAGAGILTTDTSSEGYGWHAGTSLACAEASAIAALALERKPGLMPALLRAHLVATGTPAPLAPGLGPLLDAANVVMRLGEGQLITGVVVDNAGAVVPGVTVTLDGPVHQELHTNGDGVFAFSGCFPGVYKLVPTKLGYNFDPQCISLTVASQDMTGLKFTAQLEPGARYRISGQVLLDGAPLPGVAIRLGLLAEETTDEQGRFTISGVPAGRCGIEPRLEGYSFDPLYLEFDLKADVTDAEFHATPASINPAAGNVSGRVTIASGAGVDGVQISMPPYPDTMTAGGGFYTFAGAADGGYTVTPSMFLQTFVPSSRGITVAGGPVSNVDFTMSTYTISGYLRYPASAPYGSAPIANQTVNLSGPTSGSTTSNASGYYNFNYLQAGMYTVFGISGIRFIYSPVSTSLVLGPSASNVDFVGTPRGQIVCQVTRTGYGAVSGVTITLTGPWTYSGVTDASGYCSISNVDDGTYTITPSYSLPPAQTFVPATASDTITNGSYNGVHSFTLDWYSLGGTVTLPAAAPHSSGPVPGISLSIAGYTTGISATSTGTNGSGVYQFTFLWTYNGWTITPSDPNFTFAPASRTVNTPPSSAAQNFTATPRGSITGTVSWAGHGSLPGVTMTATGQGAPPNFTYSTGTSGAYSLSPVYYDTYDLVPSLGGQTFTPTSRAPVVTNAAVTGQNFAVDTYTIDGHAYLPGWIPYLNDPIGGISLNSTGMEALTKTTDGAGYYLFNNLLAGNYTITPAATPSYSFAPASINRTIGPNSGGNTFIATPNGSVNGTVTWPGHGGLNGVTVSMTGVARGYTFTTTTAGAGNYSFSNVIDDTYNMTLTYGTNTFTPSAAPYNFTLSNGSALTRNFTINTYTISGQVTRACQAHGGVTVDLTGAEVLNTSTNVGGNYSFTNLLNGNYTVTPSLANFTFDPASRSVTIANASAGGRDFYSLYTPTHTLTVNVVLADGRNVQFIRVTPTGTNPHSGFTTGSPGGQVTDVNGQTVFTGLQDACNYSLMLTVEPPINPLAFSFPVNPTVVSTVISDRAVTITIIKNWFDIEGFVTDTSGTGVNGVVIDVTGVEARTTTTSTDPDTGRNGWYQFLSLDNGLYWVTPSNAGNGFVPSEREVNIYVGDMPEQNFVLHAGLFSASGLVVDQNNAPISGVTVTMHSQTAPLTATSAADGTWTIANIPYGSHLFEPGLAGYWFTPAGRTVNITGNASGIFFVGHYCTQGAGFGATSGFCTRSNGTGIAGATVTLSGFGVPRQTSTNGMGFFLFDNVPNYAFYMLTPNRSGFMFAPANYGPVSIGNNHVIVPDFIGN